ncbi:MAG: GHKL domain-containing protein [Lachnospira sp.]|nr:GHKL domain-containing protein [Lachnospira sp.]
MGYMIIEYVLSIIDTVINFVFLEKLFGHKGKRSCVGYVFMLLHFVATQYLMAHLILQMLCVISIEVLYCVLTLNGKKHEHIIWVIMLNAIYCGISSVTLPVLAIMTGKAAAELAVAGSVARIWAALIQKFLVCAVLWLILSYRGNRLNLTNIEKLAVIILITANSFIVGGFYVVSVTSSMEMQAQEELLIISLLIVIVLASCAYLIVKISAKNKQMLENHILRFQLENQGDMIENMRKNNEEVKVLRHDLKYRAVIVRDMLVEGNTKDALDNINNYIERITQAQQKTDYIKGNPSINAIIYNCACMCASKSIKFETKIITSYPEKMEQDMAIMFANLLDNAVRAEEGVQENKRVIIIEIYEEEMIIKAIINNYIEKSILDENPELRTTKNDENSHGWGMKSIRNIVEKHNGGIEFNEENNMFSVEIKISKVFN